MATIQYRVSQEHSPNGHAVTSIEFRGRMTKAAVVGYDDFRRALQENRGGVLMIDMGKATDVDSALLGLLASEAEEREAAGGLLLLCCVPARVLLLMEMLGLRQLFSMFAALSEALDFVDKTRGAPPPKTNGGAAPPRSFWSWF